MAGFSVLFLNLSCTAQVPDGQIFRRESVDTM